MSSDLEIGDLVVESDYEDWGVWRITRFGTEKYSSTAVYAEAADATARQIAAEWARNGAVGADGGVREWIFNLRQLKRANAAEITAWARERREQRRQREQRS